MQSMRCTLETIFSLLLALNPDRPILVNVLSCDSCRYDGAKCCIAQPGNLDLWRPRWRCMFPFPQKPSKMTKLPLLKNLLLPTYHRIPYFVKVCTTALLIFFSFLSFFFTIFVQFLFEKKKLLISVAFLIYTKMNKIIPIFIINILLKDFLNYIYYNLQTNRPIKPILLNCELY